MTTVRNTVTDPAGTPIPNLGVPISLITVTPATPGYTAASSIASTEVVYTDATGLWTADLTPNASISPSGSYYRITEDGQISNIRVPASGGPYQLPTLLVAPQDDGSLAITGLEVAGNGTVVATRPELNLIGGSNVTVTAVDNPGSDRVDVTITSTAGGAGPASTVTDETSYGVAKAVGTATQYAREDHTHGSPALTSTPPTNSAVGDAATVGTGTTPARSDHTHGREAFAAPGNSAVGDSANAGVATTIARSDHRHGREAFGSVTAQTSYGAASGNGSATTNARSDHTHGTPPAPDTVYTFSVPGTVSAAAGTARIYNDTGRALTILAVRASVGTAPTGQSLIVDVLRNGTTIFTTQGNRPTIAATGNTSGKVTTMDVTAFADGDYLTVTVAQVGSSTAGSDLTVQIWAA